MKEAFVLHQRNRDSKGKINIQIIGVYQKLSNLLVDVQTANVPDENTVRKGLDACGTYFISDNARLFYDIYLTTIND